MPHRFTALVLAFIIGGPLCCCGSMRGPEAPPKVEEKSCCHIKEKGAANAPKDKDCACARTPKVRSLVQTGVGVPQPGLAAPDTSLWMAREVKLPREFKEFAAVVLPEHGPPRDAERLYLCLHVLLI